jgi:hypothetical protein
MSHHRTITRVRVGDWLPDAWVNGDDIELMITEPVSPGQVIIVIPAHVAPRWAAEAATAIGRAHDRLADSQEPA